MFYLMKYKRYIRTLFRIAGLFIALISNARRTQCSFRISMALAVEPIAFLIQTSKAFQNEIWRMRTHHPTEKFRKIPLVMDLRPLEFSGSEGATIKPNPRNVRTFPLLYFHFMVLNVNSSQAIYVLQLNS